MTPDSCRDEGSTSIELAVLTPVVLTVLALMIAAGRIVTAHAALDQAATAAARAATLARTASTAQAAAQRTTLRVLAQQDLHCTQRTVHVDTAGFATPVGTSAPVTVSLSCAVPLAELGLPGLPVQVALSAEFTSPLDPYRGRQP